MTAPRRLRFDIVIILVASCTIGLAWNYTLLHRAWTGTAAPAPPPAGTAPAIPLPVGLMQVKDFHDRREAVIVDARDAASFGKGRIAGAVSLPLGEADARIPDFRKKVGPDPLLIIYCNGYSCHDSMDLGKKLIAAGFPSVYVFEGGYPEWKDAGYPVEGTHP